MSTDRAAHPFRTNSDLDQAPPTRTQAESLPIAEKDLWIGGRWVPAASGKRFSVIDPATSGVVASVAEAGAADVDRSVAAARRAFEPGPWGAMKPAERSRILWRIAEGVAEHAAELATLTTLETGKPYAQALGADVAGTISTFEHFAGWPTKFTGATVPINYPGEYHAYTEHAPLGVCAAIVPWNYPLSAAAWKVAPALAAGNTVVLKPAEATPLSALRLATICADAGLPDGVLNVVPGYGAIAGAALAEHPGVDKVSFTGSTATGRKIGAAALTDFKRVTLELGGKSPNIVFADADLDLAVGGAAKAVFSNQGEQCVAGSRLFIQDAVYDEFLERFVAMAASLPVGDGFAPDTVVGPLISPEHFDKVQSFVESGVREGATVLTGNRSPDGAAKPFLSPTVVADVQAGMRIVREEVFGPVVVATPFSTLDDVVPAANDTSYGLAAGVWTTNLSTAHLLSRRLQAGMVWINCFGVFDGELPFGGFKQSGWGREMGVDVMRHYTETRSTAIKLS